MCVREIERNKEKETIRERDTMIYIYIERESR